MQLHVFSVRDKKAEAFLPPFFVRARGEAIRSFVDAATDNKRFGSHPEDYDLYFLGLFDDVSGALIAPPHGVERLLDGLSAIQAINAPVGPS